MSRKPVTKQKAVAAPKQPDGRERVAKVMARAGVASRREAESWIAAGRVKVNGKLLTTPAFTVAPSDRIEVDGVALPSRERTRLFMYNKPKGLMTTNSDPEGRATIFQNLPKDLPRLVSVGRLDINSEGLLLLTNDGGLSRTLELPSTGWLRRYRVRANGRIDQPSLNKLKRGITVEGVVYGAIDAVLDREQGANLWLTVGIREGKNREVRKVLAHLGLKVNRLIRVSFGPFQLGDLKDGAVEEVPMRVLREQLGEQLEARSQTDFDAPIREAPKEEREIYPSKSRDARKPRDGEPVRQKRGDGKRPQFRQREPMRGREERGDKKPYVRKYDSRKPSEADSTRPERDGRRPQFREREPTRARSESGDRKEYRGKRFDARKPREDAPVRQERSDGTRPQFRKREQSGIKKESGDRKPFRGKRTPARPPRGKR
jgi:23S rRNA pseudouridine2605 synthase